jgi:tripartite-type tricarboxylate transporter receptor subunit TctC
MPPQRAVATEIGTMSMRAARSRLVATAIAILAVSVCACTQSSGADTWPARPVRLIVPYAAGSGIDLAARLYAPLLAERWQRSVVVDNRPGGDGTAGVQAFVGGNDRHTLLLAPIGVVTVIPLLHDRLPYDAERDLVPISAAAHVSMGIAVGSDVSAHSLSELIALVRRRPDQYLWGAAPGLPEMVFKAFLELEKLQMKHVPYRDTSSAVHDFNAGRLHVMVAALATMNAPLESGAARLLVVTNSTRTPAAPDIPTARESGYPALTVDGLFGFLRVARHAVGPESADCRRCPARCRGSRARIEARQRRARRHRWHSRELASAMADQQAQVNEIAKVLGLRRPGPEGGR